MFDFASLYHTYDTSSKGELTFRKLSKLLTDVGIKLDNPDINRIFYFFNTELDGYISREEYNKMLTLTDYEIDLTVDKIKVLLLSNAKTSIPALKETATLAPQNNTMRENRILSSIFVDFNTNDDGIFSLDEVLDLASSLEIFLTEEEARKVMKMMDVNGDDRVEEQDFISFMKQKTNIVIKKAYRVREMAAVLRLWLQRGKKNIILLC